MARGPSDPGRLPVVRVSAEPEPGPPRRERRPGYRWLAPAAAVAALAAVVLPPLLTSRSATLHRRGAPPARGAFAPVQRGALFADPNDPGVDAIAAAFKGPLRCLRLTFAAGDPDYVRTRAGAGVRCAPYRADGAAVYQRVDQEWRLVLYTSRYSCPIGSVPAAVQAQLRLCPRR